MASESAEAGPSPQTKAISWGEYFMGAAILAAKRSKDPSLKVGAVLVDAKKRIISIGWNGMPTGCDDKDMVWGKDKKNMLWDKLSYVCHAEANAFLFSTKVDIETASLYTTLFPCLGCAKRIIQFQVKTVYYLSDKKWKLEEYKKSKKLLGDEGVRLIDFRDFHDSKERQGKVGYSRPAEDMVLDFDYQDRDDGVRDSTGEDSSGTEKEKISWENYFMGLAILLSKRSKESVKHGAVLVDQMKRIVGVGWNGKPTGVDEEGEVYALPAAANAILFKTTPDVRGCKLYTTEYPCNVSAQLIIQSGVDEVHHLSDQTSEDKYTAAKKMFDICERDVELKKFEKPSERIIKLEFSYLDD